MQSRTKVGVIALVGTIVVAGSIAVKAKNEKAANPYRAVVKARFDALVGQMNLSNAQKKSMSSVVGGALSQARTIAHDSALEGSQKQQKMRTLQQNTRERVTKILTPAQRNAAQKLFAERQQRASGVLNEIADELQLTSAQRAEAKPIIQDGIKQARAIWQDPPTFGEKRAQLMQLHQSTNEKLASILSPAQMQKLKQMQEAVRAEVVARATQWRLLSRF